MDSDNEFLVERGLITVSKSEWERARLRTEMIALLAKLEIVNWELADNAADKLNISRRQIYTLIARCRQGHGLVSDILLNKSHDGKGKSRLPETQP